MSDSNSKKKMSRKQVLAWTAIILLVGIYVVALVFSLIDSPFAQQMFHAALYCTFIIPIMCWVFLMTVKLVKGKGYEKEDKESKE